jgi:hypothetical protein
VNSPREVALLKLEQMLDLVESGEKAKTGRYVCFPNEGDLLSIRIEVVDVKKVLEEEK